jgi:hypothetical protein
MPAPLYQGIMASTRAMAPGAAPGAPVDTTAPFLPEGLQNYLNRPTPVDVLDKYYSILVGGTQAPEPKEPLPPMDPYTNPGLTAADFLPGRTEFPSMPPPTPVSTELPISEPGDTKYTTPVAAPLDSTMFAIKQKGGNWKAGNRDPDVANGEERWSPESYVNRIKHAARLRDPNRLREYIQTDLESIERTKNYKEGDPLRQQRLDDLEYRIKHDERDLAIHEWLDTKRVNYIKNEMGTAQDPLLELAERGIRHIPIDQPGREWEKNIEWMNERRKKYGYPPSEYDEPTAKSSWELRSEMALDRMSLGEYKEKYPKDIDPWMEKAPDNTIINMMPKHLGLGRLGIEHIIDSMRDMGNPDPTGGVPDRFNLDAKDFKKMSVPQMVERVSEFDAWRINEIAEANAKLANNAATEVISEYDNGSKWVEIGPNDKSTEEDVKMALGYEGDTMGHCVGGYCEDVIEGKTRIYSLRDSKGEPHVTIEMKRETPFDERAEEYDRIRQELHDEYWEAILNGEMTSADIDMIADEKARKIQEEGGRGQWVIYQVKGKGNAKPVDKYIPMVQDFILKNKYDVVGDIEHTDLNYFHSLSKSIRDKILAKFPGFDREYITDQELEQAYSNDLNSTDFLP